MTMMERNEVSTTLGPRPIVTLEERFVFEFNTIQQENEDELNYGEKYITS
jgi:hypothetical protein